MKDTPVLSSFICAGFECTAARGEHRRRLDLLGATKHDVYSAQDYQLITEVGITTVREGFAWSTVAKEKGEYDFSRYIPILEAGQKNNIQQIWDLNHFDYPDYLDPFTDEFIQSYAEHARKCIEIIRQYQKPPFYIVPLNEISFFAWIGADQGHWAPYLKGQNNGFRFKQQLVKAAIAAMEEIWKIDETVRFIQVDPFMRRLAKSPSSARARKQARDFNNIIRFEAWDMLAGKKYPELGGDPKYLDIIGINYYIHNQEWVLTNEQRPKIGHQMMDWDSEDRISFAAILEEVYLRYQRPIMISETGSFGEFRLQWWERTFKEIEEGLNAGLPICGVCAYPILDRPDTAGFLLPESGLWDFNQTDPELKRIPYTPVLDLIKQKHWTVDN